MTSHRKIKQEVLDYNTIHWSALVRENKSRQGHFFWNWEQAMEQRQSARAILLNKQNQVLLIKYEDTIPVDPAQPDILCYWATPGGGIKSGERLEDALKRELLEELGLTEVTIGQPIGVREVQLNLPEEGTVISHETYFVCRMMDTPQLNHDGMSESERRVFRGVKWWSLEALHNSTEILRPAELPELVEKAFRTGPEFTIIAD